MNLERAMELSGFRNHAWTRKMNKNLLRVAMSYTDSVKSMTTTLPASAADGDMYIDPLDGKICMWVPAFDDNIGDPQPAQWWRMDPGQGRQVYVQDLNKVFLYNMSSVWELLVDIGATHRGVEREFSFYSPGLLRPSATVFYYIAGLEFTIEAGAPNSGASLETAPSATLVLPIMHQGDAVGTITFASSSKSGVIAFPNERVVQPAHAENQYVQANALSVLSPPATYGASGLSLTLRGKIRAID